MLFICNISKLYCTAANAYDGLELMEHLSRGHQRLAHHAASRCHEGVGPEEGGNGRTVGLLTYSADSQQTVVVELKKGQNTVRLHNDHERMPDVDYLLVETK